VPASMRDIFCFDFHFCGDAAAVEGAMLRHCPRPPPAFPAVHDCISRANPNAKGTAAVTVLPIEVKVSPATINGTSQ
jgi:hypothetical protein